MFSAVLTIFFAAGGVFRLAIGKLPEQGFHLSAINYAKKSEYSSYFARQVRLSSSLLLPKNQKNSDFLLAFCHWNVYTDI